MISFAQVTEACLGGNLLEWIDQLKGQEVVICRIAQEVTGVLAHCHSRYLGWISTNRLFFFDIKHFEPYPDEIGQHWWLVFLWKNQAKQFTAMCLTRFFMYLSTVYHTSMLPWKPKAEECLSSRFEVGEHSLPSKISWFTDSGGRLWPFKTVPEKKPKTQRNPGDWKGRGGTSKTITMTSAFFW